MDVDCTKPPNDTNDASALKQHTLSEKLCQELSLNNVDLTYENEDFQNLTTFKLFSHKFRHLFNEQNPNVMHQTLTRVIRAKWNEFNELKSQQELNVVQTSVPTNEIQTTKDATSQNQISTQASKDEDDDEQPRFLRSRRNKLTSSSSSDSLMTHNTRSKRRKRKNSESDVEYQQSEEDWISQESRPKRKGRIVIKRSTKQIRATTRKKATVNYSENLEEMVIENQSECDICFEGGDIIMCDGCPKSYHLTCLEPKLEVVPEGDWFCSNCSNKKKPGRKAAKPKLVDDVNSKFCYTCKDGGQLLCCNDCDYCFHVECMNPVVKLFPKSAWNCPICTSDTPKAVVKQIFTWRWKQEDDTNIKVNKSEKSKNQLPALRVALSKPKNDDDDYEDEAIDLNEDSAEDQEMEDPSQVNQSSGVSKTIDSNFKSKNHPVKRSPMKVKEFFCKFDCLSYWHCDWVSELSLEKHQKMLLRNFVNRVGLNSCTPENPMIEPDEHDLEIDVSSKHLDPILYERYFKYGVLPDYLRIQRILSYSKLETGEEYYLIKWRALNYDQSTWELENGEVLSQIPDWENHKQSYQDHKNLIINNQKQGDDSKGKCKVDPKQMYQKQPEYIDKSGGNLHPYQLDGLNWLRFSWSQGTDVILADEMGLGKTIQAVTFLYSLFKENHTKGPFLVVAPLSTIVNWEREFEFWAPEMYVVSYVGFKESRQVIRDYEFSFDENPFHSNAGRFRRNCKLKFHVLLTSYEMVSIDSTTLGSIDWQALVIDEAHRLKCNHSKFFKTLFAYRIQYKVLLTGTPLQNNLQELFHLLNFLSPREFSDLDEFLQEFSDLTKDEHVKKLHHLLGPHLLRRLKADVFKTMPPKSELIVRIDMSQMQKKYYKLILTKNYEALNSKKGGQQSLMNIVMQLKKVCNHPYLLRAAQDDVVTNENGLYKGESLIESCGKLDLLFKMLKKLKEQGHRVLLFSQMTKMLDIIEDFLFYSGYKFERIDGSITGADRQTAIDRFNAPDAQQFIFLLSTRAGGLGINLATADTVIIYDSDWNPHNDIQAFSRAHRIGQKNKVMIYRFVTRGSVEERIAQVAKQKMMLTHLVVRPGMGSGEKKQTTITKKELEDILRFGTEELFKDSENDANKIEYDDVAVENLLDRNQETPVVEEANEGLNEYLSSFKVASYVTKELDKDEVAKQNSDPEYWAKLMGVHIEKEQAELGKGKRLRKPVNYNQQTTKQAVLIEEINTSIGGDDKSLNNSEYSAPSSDESSDDDDDLGDNEFDELAEVLRPTQNTTQAKQSKQSKQVNQLPPLIAVKGNDYEVLGFNSRQRSGFFNAVMRFGMPSNIYNNRWIPKGLKNKSPKELNAYVKLFSKHLGELVNNEAMVVMTGRFSDGVPSENITKNTLSRIAYMALINRKVKEYESINGTYPISESDDIPFYAYNFLNNENTNNTNDTSDSEENGENDDSDQSSNGGFFNAFFSSPTHTPQIRQLGTDLTNLTNIRPSIKSNNAFSFDISDGNLTDLKREWSNENKFLGNRLWTKRHDYWLLCAVSTHGYSKWNEIYRDPRFNIISEPYKNYEQESYKSTILSRRLKLLERALLIEEQIGGSNASSRSDLSKIESTAIDYLIRENPIYRQASIENLKPTTSKPQSQPIQSKFQSIQPKIVQHVSQRPSTTQLVPLASSQFVRSFSSDSLPAL